MLRQLIWVAVASLMVSSFAPLSVRGAESSQARVPDVDPSTLSGNQRRVFDEIAGVRGRVSGPFSIWVRNVALADAANKLGSELRRGKLERGLFELTTLIIARHWTAQFLWFAHETPATDNGVSQGVVDAIRFRTTPPWQSAKQRVLAQLTIELLEQRSVSDGTYAQALDAFGLDILIEIVADIGFYSMVASTVVAFNGPVPGGAKPLPN